MVQRRVSRVIELEPQQDVVQWRVVQRRVQLVSRVMELEPQQDVVQWRVVQRLVSRVMELEPQQDVVQPVQPRVVLRAWPLAAMRA